MADVASKDRATRRKVRPKGRWLPIVVGSVAAGILAVVAWFGLHFFRESAYEDERAFRILGHIVGQFGNFQGAVAGALKVVPTGTYLPRDEKVRDEEIKKYHRSLALREVTVTPEKVDKDACGSSPEFRIDLQRDFSMWRVACCDAKDSKACGPVPPTRLTLSGPLAPQLPAFIFQDFFDSVVITSSEGVTLASVPRGQDRGYQVELHEVAAVDPIGGNAAELLHRAQQHIVASGGAAKLAADGEEDGSSATGTTDGSKPEAGALPGYATVFNDRIAGQSVRVFVLPFVPAQPTWVDDKESTQLYLIALKKQRLLGALNEALGSGGALAVTLSVLFGILAWPLLSLRFESPQEGIAPIQVFAILVSLFLVPAVIATAGFSLWTRHRLMAWADTHAELYARRVEQVLIEELDTGVHVLEQLMQQYRPYAPFTRGQAEAGPEESGDTPDGNIVCVKSFECRVPLDWYRSPDAPMGWSPIRSAAPLNEQGKSFGFTVSYFAPALVSDLDLHDRQYFQAVMQHEEWKTGTLWGHRRAHAYVAQRLFNRTDAARVLQLAIPMDDEKSGKRLGVVTGDTRVYGLAQAMRPPLLRFAVLDNRNGSVLFHSRERLSLAENLLVETEHNSSLQTAMQRRASTWTRYRILAEDHFGGRYLAASHRFLYRAVAGAPWGIVVFYPTDGINDMVLQTAVATLATYFATIIVLTLAFAVLFLALPERADQVALKWIWPRWQLRDVYRRGAWWSALAILAIAIVVVGRLSRFQGWEIAVVVVVTGLLGWGVERLRDRWLSSTGVPSLTAYKRNYVQCIFGVLVLLSALPATWLAIGYHDTSVRAVIRDELVDALGDEQQRRLTLARDHQRFTTEEGLAPDEAAERSRRLPVPGYRAPGKADERRTWLVRDVEPAPWLGRCGPEPLSEIRRLIWSLSTARQVQRPIVQSQVTDAPEQNPTDSGGCEDPIVARAWLRSEDGVRTRIGFPLERLSDDLRVPVRCESGTRRSESDLCRDEDLYRRYAVSSVSVPAAIVTVAIFLITLMSALAARRLFGIRIPFTSRFTPSDADQRDVSQLLDAELDLLDLKKREPMTSKDEADWRAVNCRHIYQRMWNALETDEQFLVHQLAYGQLANPENRAVIERLLRRGYLTLAPWPRIVEPGFADFVRTVAPDESFDQLKYDATHTLWSQLRAPLLVLVVIIAVLLMWLAGSAMHLVAATLAGVAGLFGSIQRVTSFLHRDKPPAAVD